MVLVAAAIVFAGLGVISLPGSDAEPASQAGGVTTTTAPAASTGAAAPTARDAAAAGAQASASGERTGARSATDAVTATRTTSGSAAEAPADGASGNTAAARASSASEAHNTPVRVYNNSTVEGLAHRTAQELKTDGFTVGKIANYDGGTVPHSAVFYGDSPGEKAAAEKVGAQLGVPVEPRFDGISDASPGVIVILTADG